MLADPYYWNALLNMVYYVLAVLVQYAIAFGLALLLNADIRARKFFRVVFLLPFMLSPVAVSWMIGKSLMEYRFGPAATLARHLGWEIPAFFASPGIARLVDHGDGRLGLHPVHDDPAARRPAGAAQGGARGGQGRRRDALAVVLADHLSADAAGVVTAIILRIIFKLKLADIVINVTAGGPGGATDTVSSFIFREYRDRSNVGYGTMLAMVYLVLIIVFVTVLLKLASRWMRRCRLRGSSRPLPRRRAAPHLRTMPWALRPRAPMPAAS